MNIPFAIQGTGYKKILALILGTLAPVLFAAEGDLSLLRMYQNSVATVHEKSLPSAALVSFHPGQIAQVLTWTTHDYSKGVLDLSRSVWVVSAQEMKSHWPEIMASADPSLRINQLLGMPPQEDESKDHWVLFQVPVENYLFKINQASEKTYTLTGEIIRPCQSSGDVSLSRCEGAPETGETPYSQWIASIAAQTKGYPWTGKGYTYDWNPGNLSHQGLSEFILPQGASVEVKNPQLSVVAFCEVGNSNAE